jgi:aldose sugar dehydrogenase
MKNTCKLKEISWGIHFKSSAHRQLLIAAFACASFCCFSQSTLVIGTTTVAVDTVYTGLDVPWEILYGTDDHLWITERKGRVSRIDPAAKTRTVVLDITADVYAEQEAGLLGMAINYQTNEVFLVYTYGIASNVKEKLVKYTYNGTTLVSPVVILDNIKGGTAHNGSRLMFLPDGTLLMTTGDAQTGAFAQDFGHLNGKVLRILQNGSIPGDNPSPSQFTYSFGHRNCQGICLGPTGKIYASEHGPTTDDEFQEVLPNRNYGWPDVAGFCDSPSESAFCAANNVKEPLLHWTPTIAPAAVTYYENNSFPEFNGRFLLTTLRTKKLVAIELNAAGTASVSEASYLQNLFGRLRCTRTGSSKEIYIGTNGAEAFNIDPNTHSIIRLTPPAPVAFTQEKGHQPRVKCYPSVTDKYLNVYVTSGQRSAIEIFDLTGKCVLTGLFDQVENLLNLALLENGLYFVMVRDDKAVLYRGKMIKN